MWIEVRGGPAPLWVQSDECRLPSGELAFVIESMPVPPLPDWFEAPLNSKLRSRSDHREFGWPLIEHRSMRAGSDRVVAFYEGLIEKAQLTRQQPLPVGCIGPGLHAENAEYRISIQALEHKETTFWTIQFNGRSDRRSKPLSTRFFTYVDGNKEGVTLQHESKDEKYWAPINALRDSEPPRVEPPRKESILWSSLPAWVQFGFNQGSHHAERYYGSGQNLEQWQAMISRVFEGDPASTFEACLDSLDAHGFDPSGTERPNNSYYISIIAFQRAAHVQSEAGDRATFLVQEVVGMVALSIRYWPPGPVDFD